MRNTMLPKEWCFKAVEELVTIRKGRKTLNISYSKKDSYFPIINIDNLRGGPDTQFSNDRSGVVCEKNDILIVWDGANAGTVGTGFHGYVGSTIAKLQINDLEKLDSMYFFYYLKSKFDYLNSRTSGATIPHLDRNFLVSLMVPIPPIEQQKKIVMILKKAGGTLYKRKEANQLADKYLKSVFLEMFVSDDSREGWDEKLISDIAIKGKNSIRTGPFGSDLLHSEFVEEGIPVIGIDNAVRNKFTWGERRFITEEKYKKLQRYTLYPRDVIITIMGTTGRSTVIPNNIGCAINSKHLAAITIDEKIANPYFIAYSIHSDPHILGQIRTKNKGAVMNGLNLKIIKQLEVKLPPLHLQNEFSNILERIEKLKQRQEESSNMVHRLFNALMQKAFRGELTNKDYIPKFEVDSLKNIIQSEFVNRNFDYEELVFVIKKRYGNIEYDKIKMAFYKCLERQNNYNTPYIVQRYDNIKKKIFFKIN